jgi:hypothetical protein
MANRTKKPRLASTLSGGRLVQALSKETQRFQELCRLRAAENANGSREQHLKELRSAIAESRLHLKRMAIQAEEIQGAYNTIVEAFRTIALAERE